MLYLGVALAGALGAPARYLVEAWVSGQRSRAFPWGTLVVNLSGSFLLGLLTGLVLHHAFPTSPQVLLGAGFCGAYTTYSTFAVETVRLAERGLGRAALANVALSVGGGLLAAAAGLALAAL